MAEITLRDVRKSYGANEVLHGIDCAVRDGEFLVVVGPSGCGKSTLLRMVAGLESITGGEVGIGSRVVNTLEPAERDIAMVFQNYALYPHMSVYKNMAYGLKIKGLKKAEIDRRVNNAADILEIREYLDRMPRQLSGGQRQRVAMGRAIVREPEVFLFDEPLSNLDAKLRVQMRLEIKRLQERLGITSLYVTHDQVEAMTLGHRLMVLNDGHVEQLGTPIELYERPETKFVGGFIGSPAMNFIDGHLRDRGRKAELPGGRMIDLDDRLAGHADMAVTIGIRPEHFEIADDEFKALPHKVVVVEHLGADTLAHGRLGSGDQDVTVRLSGIRDVASGTVLSLKVDPAHVHVFGADTGIRLG